ncbi:hypothetical protein [Clostridium sporogenes]|uniref:hypothetical protein n=1 Tax=Clostridium sporogenes TaxID=1509 RepID=UPI001969D34D|nr:hypothetical protein [Clostridium sporogenes]
MGCSAGSETKFHTCDFELFEHFCDDISDLKLSIPIIISYYCFLEYGIIPKNYQSH